METNKEIQDELKELSPFLYKLKEKGDGFKIPENYFNSMQEEVVSKISPKPVTQKEKQEKRTSFLDWISGTIHIAFQPRYAIGLATIVLLIGIGVIFLSTPEESMTFEKLTYVEMENYIESNIDEFDVELLSNLVDNDKKTDIFSGSTIYDEELIEYLNDEIEEIEESTLEEIF